MNGLYLDASAVLSVLFEERDAESVRARIAISDFLTSSRLLLVEFDRALLRLALDVPQREADIGLMRRSFAVLLPKLSLIEVTADLCSRAGRVAKRTRLRALDAIHLASFLRVREIDPEVEMLTFDIRLQNALSHL